MELTHCTAISEYIDQYSGLKKERLQVIRNLIHEAVPEIQEKMWAKIPTFYMGKSKIQFLAFKDHINIFASGIPANSDALTGFAITDKGTLKISDMQDNPVDILKSIFAQSIE